jgi:nucleotidyltransferase substrate binding protein (TIGR01987 family)
MEQTKKQRLLDSLEDLDRAISAFTPSSRERSLSFLAASKAFEVCIEYAWKYYKHLVEDKGIEVFSPKDTVREAARLDMISDPGLWIECINIRNLSVHDYFSISEEDFIKIAKKFLKSAQSDLL